MKLFVDVFSIQYLQCSRKAYIKLNKQTHFYERSINDISHYVVWKKSYLMVWVGNGFSLNDTTPTRASDPNTSEWIDKLNVDVWRFIMLHPFQLLLLN
jgi:hypothetical protein